MPKDTRDKVTLSPEAFKALEVEAMLHDDSLKDTASKLILKAACPKCKEILDIMARPAKEHKAITTQEPNVPIAQEPKDESDNGLKSPLDQGHNDTIAQVSEVMQTKEQNVTMSQEPKGDMTKGPKVPKAKGHKLSQDPIALAKLKELYGLNPRPSLVTMGKELGYSKSTIADNIKRLKEKGELNAVHSDAIS